MRRTYRSLSESATSVFLFRLLRVLSWSESELLDDELEEYRLLNNNWVILTDWLSLTTTPSVPLSRPPSPVSPLFPGPTSLPLPLLGLPVQAVLPAVTDVPVPVPGHVISSQPVSCYCAVARPAQPAATELLGSLESSKTFTPQSPPGRKSLISLEMFI